MVAVQENASKTPVAPGVAQNPADGTTAPRLLDRLRQALRSRHYSPRTEQTYGHWVRRFIYFHNISHPAGMAEPAYTVCIYRVLSTNRSSVTS